MISGLGIWLFSPVENVATRPGPILQVLPELHTRILSWGSVAKLNNFQKYFWTGASFPYGNSRAPVPYLTRLNWFWELYANFAVRSVAKTLWPLGVLTRWPLTGSPGCFLFLFFSREKRCDTSRTCFGSFLDKPESDWKYFNGFPRPFNP